MAQCLTSTFNYHYIYPGSIMHASQARKAFNWDDKVVLIAEDEKINFVLLKSVFEQSNATVIWAQDGEQAVENFRNHDRIDLVILDYMMPKLNGLDAARCIKKVQQNIPVILQSTNHIDKEELNSISFNNIAYFQKPVNPKQIISKAEDMLSE